MQYFYYIYTTPDPGNNMNNDLYVRKPWIGIPNKLLSIFQPPCEVLAWAVLFFIVVTGYAFFIRNSWICFISPYGLSKYDWGTLDM